MTREQATRIRYQLTDARKLCESLGLAEGSKPNGKGLLIRCPAHQDRTPSCGVTPGPDGTLRARCFSCDWTGDALDIIAKVRGLSLRSADEFREVLIEGAEIAGDLGLADEIRGDAPRNDRPRRVVQPPPQEPERPYPPIETVMSVWESSIPLTEDDAAYKYLQGRAIHPESVDARYLLRVIPPDSFDLPAWASYKGRSWNHSGHRIIARVWDHDGTCRSMRAWQCDGIEGPKRLPPAGHKAQGLVLANRDAVRMLSGKGAPSRLIIVEGEPDWTTWSSRVGDGVAVIGIGSGLWTVEHAEKIPAGLEVIVRTHQDDAGNRYAEHIVGTINNRCPVWRAR
jgi:hypothetical protein